MRKLLLAGVMVLGISSLALAGWGHGNGHGGGWGHGGGYGHGGGMMNGGGGMPCWNNGQMMNDGYGMGGNQQAPEASVKDEKGAKAAVQEVLDNNFKGYKVTKVEPFQMPRGTRYNVYVEDASGNPFLFHVNPWGRVVGPMLNK